MGEEFLVRLCRDVVTEDLHGEVLLCDTDRAVVHRVPTADAPWAADLALGVAVEVGDGLLVRQLIDAGLVEHVGTTRRQIITRTAGAAAVAGAASIVLPKVAAAASGPPVPPTSAVTTTTTTVPPATTWALSSFVPPAGIIYRSVAHGGGTWVAVGSPSSQRVATSTDGGETWTPRDASSNTQPWNAVTYGNGTFVAVGGGGTNRLMTSTDGGSTWTGRAAPTSATTFNSVAWAPVGPNAGTFGTFVAVGGGGTAKRMIRSVDGGETWTAATTAPTTVPPSWSSVTWGNVGGASGMFVAVANNTTSGGVKVAYSTDAGDTWATVSIPGTTAWTAVAFGGGAFVAVSNGFNTMRATDPTTADGWTEAPNAPEFATYNAITYGSGRFVAAATSMPLMASTDGGVTWSVLTTPEYEVAGGWGVATDGTGGFVSVGGNIAYSPA